MKLEKFIRKFDNFLRRLTIIRLFYILIFVTFIFTSYLYGLIQIDSHKLVINIIPENDLKKSLKFDYVNSDLNSGENSNLLLNKHKNYINDFENIIINLNENINIDEMRIRNDNKKRNRPDSNRNKQKLNSNNRINKYILKLFKIIESSENKITSILSHIEIKELINQKQKYQNILLERNKKLREELKKELEATKNIKNNDIEFNDTNKINANNNYNGTADYDINDILITQLSSDEIINREVVIKSIRYEKVKLKKKLEKPLKSIKMVVDEFKSKNDFELSDLPPIWSKFFFDINEKKLYNDSKNLESVVKKMSTLPVINCSEKEKGTQIKLILVLSDGTDVLVKPMKVNRDYQTPPDHFYFVDFERHHAEIAAFHVDKLLGFNRVPPTVGRLFNMTADLLDKADSELAKTFFYSPAGNVCFTGHCSYYCDTTHAICGRPKDRMEGSVQLMLPNKPLVKWKIVSHPYRRSYNKKKKAEWEKNSNYCSDKVFRDLSYHSKLLLDLMDMSIFDFLIGNMDRHHYERIISLGNETFPIHLDNGRAFGKPFEDDRSILEPIKQCCFIRFSTFNQLKFLYLNKFSKLLDESLKSDPLYPILTKSHLDSIDRRMIIIFNELSKCIDKFSIPEVVIDDGY